MNRLIRLVKASMRVTWVYIETMGSKPSKKVLEVMGEHLHRKVTGRRMLPDFGWKIFGIKSSYFRGILGIERNNANDILSDLDDGYKDAEGKRNKMLAGICSTLTIIAAAWTGYTLRSAIMLSIMIVGYISGDEIIAETVIGVISPSSILYKVVLISGLMLTEALNIERRKIYQLYTAVADVGATLLSYPVFDSDELSAIALIDKPEIEEIFLAYEDFEQFRGKLRWSYMIWQVYIKNWILRKVTSPQISVLLTIIIVMQDFWRSEKISQIIALCEQQATMMGYLQATVLMICPTIGYQMPRLVVIYMETMNLFLIEIAGDLLRYGGTWSGCSQLLPEHTISEYWRDNGLNGQELFTIGIEARDPDKERSNITEGYDIYDELSLPSYVENYINATAYARQDDSAHCASIHKRLGGYKRNPDVIKVIKQFISMLTQFLKGGETSNITDSIAKAIGTEGTAGEWGKHSIIGDTWKKLEDPISIALWEELVPKLMVYVSIGMARAEKLFCYMLYRKREVLPVDNDGNVKVTRLIQAAGLELRMCDAVVFRDFNEAMASNRASTYSDIGLRIDHELPAFLDPWEVTWKIVADFSDFDGHQHPLHMMICKYMRMIWNIIHIDDVGKMVLHNRYLHHKYKLHVERIVNSNWGIRIEMMGQLASGDIVTSDDNTARACGFIGMVMNAMDNKTSLRGQLDAKAAGDDISFKGNYLLNPINVAQNSFMVADGLGYKLKEMHYYESTIAGDAPVKLGHIVEAVVLIYANDATITVPSLARPPERLYGKMFRCAELPKHWTSDTCDTVVSKTFSYMTMLWAMPEVAMLGAIILIETLIKQEKSKKKKTDKVRKDIPYSWTGIKFEKDKISPQDNIRSVIGIEVESQVTMIKNENRVIHQAEANAALNKLYSSLSIVEKQYLTEDGWFKYKEFYDDLKKLLPEEIIVNTQYSPNDTQHEVTYSIQKCEHYEGTAAEDIMCHRKGIYLGCYDCLTSTFCERGQYRICMGHHPSKQTIFKTEDERSMATTTLQMAQEYEDKVQEAIDPPKEQLPGQEIQPSQENNGKKLMGPNRSMMMRLTDAE